MFVFIVSKSACTLCYALCGCVHVRVFVHVNVRNGEWNLKMREEKRCFLLVLLFSSFCLFSVYLLIKDTKATC